MQTSYNSSKMYSFHAARSLNGTSHQFNLEPRFECTISNVCVAVPNRRAEFFSIFSEQTFLLPLSGGEFFACAYFSKNKKYRPDFPRPVPLPSRERGSSSIHPCSCNSTIPKAYSIFPRTAAVFPVRFLRTLKSFASILIFRPRV